MLISSLFVNKNTINSKDYDLKIKDNSLLKRKKCSNIQKNSKMRIVLTIINYIHILKKHFYNYVNGNTSKIMLQPMMILNLLPMKPS